MTAHLHPHFEAPPEPEIEDVELDAGHFFSEDFGTTLAEEHRVEPLDLRVRHEEPEVDAGPADDGAEAAVAEEAVDAFGPSPHVDASSHWNLLVTVRPGRMRAAQALVRRVGTLQPSPYPDDVLLARVDDVFEALDMIDRAMGDDPLGRAAIARVRPAQHTFACTSLDELERVTAQVVDDWLDDLANTGFHVRCNHRGDSDDIDGAEEEAFLGEVVLKALEANGAPARIDFRDPDVVIDVETIDGQGAIALWTRADLHAYPFLRLR
jgi:tRNA(Ser,Leu) C12 N-acetylase TAN1